MIRQTQTMFKLGDHLISQKSLGSRSEFSYPSPATYTYFGRSVVTVTWFTFAIISSEFPCTETFPPTLITTASYVFGCPKPVINFTTITAISWVGGSSPFPTPSCAFHWWRWIIVTFVITNVNIIVFIIITFIWIFNVQTMPIYRPLCSFYRIRPIWYNFFLITFICTNFC